MTMIETKRPGFLESVPPCEPTKTSVAVLMGGISAEREVSLMSGREVSRALREVGFRVKDIDLHPDEVGMLEGRDFAAVFIALHGKFGEDGALQRELDRRRIVYTGSGAESSARAMDKVAAKEAFVAAGLSTPEWRIVRRGDRASVEAAREALGPRLVVKPIDEGSSVGVTMVESDEDYTRGLDVVFGMREAALVERMVRGRELTAGVLADEGLPVVEIIPTHRFYDYQAKYFDDATRYVTGPEDIAAEVQAAVRSAAVAAHRALGCRDFSRVDFLLDESGRPWVLEVNTIPGFTTHSLLPKSAAGAGIDFPRLCRYIVELALVRRGGVRGRQGP